MREVRLYIEGDRRLRPGFGKFFERVRNLVRSRRVGWNVTLCGGRDSAFDSFKTALAQHSDAFNILLVDSEGPVTDKPWDHLRARDGWTPPGLDHEHCQLMVQNMEAWFLADISALTKYYGARLNESALPRRVNVEENDKQTVATALTNAVKSTTKPRYEKVVHGMNLLTLLDEATVRSRAPHCDRLFRTIEAQIVS